MTKEDMLEAFRRCRTRIPVQTSAACGGCPLAGRVACREILFAEIGKALEAYAKKKSTLEQVKAAISAYEVENGRKPCRIVANRACFNLMKAEAEKYMPKAPTPPCCTYEGVHVELLAADFNPAARFYLCGDWKRTDIE